MITICIVVLLCAYCFVAGQFYEFFRKSSPAVPFVKNLLLSLAWPGNVAAFLLMRCVR